MERRKPLKRTGPLQRKTALAPKHGAKLVTRKRIQARPKPKRSPIEQEASEVWRSIIVARGCEVCHHRGEVCEGRLQGHHVLTRQQLRQHGLSHLDWDIQNGLCVCEKAHRRHHNRRQPIERSLLRPENIAFAERVDLMRLIEKFYPLISA